MSEMIWFAVGFAITLIVIAVADSLVQRRSAIK